VYKTRLERSEVKKWRQVCMYSSSSRSQ